MTTDDLPEAPEYVAAAQLIADMREAATLGDRVYSEPWDRLDQCGALALAARQYSGAVAVVPQLPEVDASAAAAGAGVLKSRLCILLLYPAQLPGKERARKASRLLYAVLNFLLNWQPSRDTGLPYREPTVTDVSALSVADYKEFKELTGVVIGIDINSNYKIKPKKKP